MENKNALLYIGLTIVGFGIWNAFHVVYEADKNKTTEILLFPIIVPVISSMVVVLLSMFVPLQDEFKITETYSILTKDNNFLFLLISSIGLGIGYYFLTLSVNKSLGGNPSNIPLITASNVVVITVVLFLAFYDEETKKFIYKLTWDWVKVTGVVVTIVGIFLMKYGKDIIKH